MGAEIERKWVVQRVPPEVEGGRWDTRKLEQGYLAVTGDVEVRIRRADGGAAWLTVKSAPALTRTEEELVLEDGAFERLWPLTEGRRLVKHRYSREADRGVVLELDVYDGALDGLAVLEVEFPSQEAAAAFTAPDWVGAEVTGDRAYANQTLALHGLPPAS
jgi:CYTH domain-containing protein